jgi:hypothetical protein
MPRSNLHRLFRDRRLQALLLPLPTWGSAAAGLGGAMPAMRSSWPPGDPTLPTTRLRAEDSKAKMIGVVLPSIVTQGPRSRRSTDLGGVPRWQEIPGPQRRAAQKLPRLSQTQRHRILSLYLSHATRLSAPNFLSLLDLLSLPATGYGEGAWYLYPGRESQASITVSVCYGGASVILVERREFVTIGRNRKRWIWGPTSHPENRPNVRRAGWAGYPTRQRQQQTHWRWS